MDDGEALNWAEPVGGTQTPFKKGRLRIGVHLGWGGRLEEAADLLGGTNRRTAQRAPHGGHSPHEVCDSLGPPSSLCCRVFALPDLGSNRAHLCDQPPALSSC